MEACSEVSASGITDPGLLHELKQFPECDEHNEIRGYILEHVYPSCINAYEVFDYLIPISPDYFGAYWLFLTRGWVDNTTVEHLPILMEMLVRHEDLLHHLGLEDHKWGSLVGNALVRVLEQHGDRVSAEVICEWLEVGLGSYGQSLLLAFRANDKLEYLYKWFSVRPVLIRQLFELWVRNRQASDGGIEMYLFYYHLHGYRPSIEFYYWCMSFSVNIVDEEVARAVFFIGVTNLMLIGKWSGNIIEYVYMFVEDNIRFAGFIEDVMQSKLHDGYLSEKMRDVEVKRENDREKTENLKYFEERIAGIKAGTDFDAIFKLSQVFCLILFEAGEDANPKYLLVKKTTEGIVQAAEYGFVQCVLMTDCQMPEEIGRQLVMNKIDRIGWVTIAAMELSYGKGCLLFERFPDSKLMSILCYSFAISGRSENSEWVLDVIGSRPELAAQALLPFWRVQLRSGKDHINGLNALAWNDRWASVAEQVVMPILDEFPNLAGSNLRNVLLAALRSSHRQRLVEMALRVVDGTGNRVQDWPWWAAAAFIVEQALWTRIQPQVMRNREDAVSFMDFVNLATRDGGVDDVICIKNYNFTVSSLRDMVRAYSSQWPPKDWMDRTRSEERLDIVGKLEEFISRLGAESSLEATEALQSLVSDSNLAAWRDYLRHALAQQRQLMADKSFESLTIEAVVEVVKGGAPATARDLHALVADQIRTIAGELRNSNTDGYKAYWNVDEHGRVQSPIPENNARDRMLEKLQNVLSPLGIHAEPEGHYADDTRADIKILYRGWNLPVEIKRHYHRELWRAPMEQLVEQYARDPGAAGQGIYLVFWYGDDASRRMPTPPKGGAQPGSARELESALTENIPVPMQNGISVIVLDVSKPDR